MITRTDIFGRETSAWNGTTVRISYKDSKGKTSDRVVKHIVFRGGCMVGSDSKSGECRSFKVSGITKMEMV